MHKQKAEEIPVHLIREVKETFPQYYTYTAYFIRVIETIHKYYVNTR